MSYLIMAAVFAGIMLYFIDQSKKKEYEIEMQKKELESLRIQRKKEEEEIKQIGNIIHLYAALSEEETRTEEIREKQREIMVQAEKLIK